MRAGLYARVSTEEQAKEGFSIEAQLRVLDAGAVLKGCAQAVRFVDDGYTAKHMNRPAIKRLIQACRNKEIDIVIVWRLDRFSRSLRDTLEVLDDEFRANGIEIISLTENIDTSTPAGRLMLNILASFAQNEREVNEERVRMVMGELAKGCFHMGGVPPYGLMVGDDRRYQIDEREALAVQSIYDQYDKGMSGKRIQSWLTEHGHLTRQGKAFSISAIHDILRNEKYNGTYVYNRAAAARRDGKRNNRASKPDSEIIRIPGGIPAIIVMDQWRRVQEKMNTNQHTGGRSNAKEPYLLSGLIYCGKCGRHMTALVSGRDRDGTMQRRYACPDKCVKRIRKEKAEAYVLDYLCMLAGNPHIVEQAVDIANGFTDTENDERRGDLAPLEERAAQIDAQLRSILDFIRTAGASAPASLVGEIQALDQEKADIEREIERVSTTLCPFDAQEVLAGLKRIAGLKNADMEEQKKAIAQAVRRVVVFDDHIDVVLDNSNCGGGDPMALGQLSALVFTILRRV